MDLRHAGVGWPNGAVDNAKILTLPSTNLLMLNSEHWHIDEVLAEGKRVLLRGVPEIGSRPAETGYSPDRYVKAATLHLDNHKPQGFIAWNELDLNGERGDGADDFSDLDNRYRLLGQFQLHLLVALRNVLPPTTDLHYGAWTPDHQALDHIDLWREAAETCDVVDVHAYGQTPAIMSALASYRAAFPTKRLALTEWHASGDLASERETLQALANLALVDPLFDGAYFFIWRWDNAPEWWSDGYDIEHNDARLDLFLHPPIVTEDPGHANETGGSGSGGTDTGTPAPDHVDDAMNPWQFWSAEQIAAAIPCTVQAVQANWHRIVEQLDHCGLNDQSMQLAALGTIAAESQSFQPIEEYRNADGSIPNYWNDYDGGANYHGRGFIQVTHAYNYRAYGEAVRQLWDAGADDPTFDLVAHPENALDPDIAAAVLACYFRDHADGALVVAAHAGNWTEVRRLVNGGTGRLEVQNATIAALSGTPPVVVAPVFDSTVPIVPQNFDWDCAEQSLLWGMTAYGRHPLDSWMEGQMLAEHIESTELGLLDGGGAGLAAFVVEQYGEFGYSATSQSTASYDDVIQVAGHSPVLIGGRHWGTAGHWSGVRGYDSQHDVLFLANPANGYGNVFQAMTRAQFNQVGPCAMVVITWGGAVAPPVQPAPPQPDEVAHLRTVLGYASHDVADALQQQVDAIVVSLDGLRAAINTLRQQGAA